MKGNTNTGSIKCLGYFSPLYQSDIVKSHTFYVGFSPVSFLMTHCLIVEYVYFSRIVYMIHVWLRLYFGMDKGINGPLLGPSGIKG